MRCEGLCCPIAADCVTVGSRMAVRTIEWRNGSVVMIDQRLLPTREVYRVYRDHREVARAIKDMVIRGAPAIGVAAAMGIALGMRTVRGRDVDAAFQRLCRTFAATRPTAVNLFWAIERMRAVYEAHRDRPLPELLSADYTFDSGIETLHQAVRVDARPLRVVDSVRLEVYERVDSARDGAGFAVQAEKRIGERFSVGGGFVGVDRYYPHINSADGFGVGRAVFFCRQSMGVNAILTGDLGGDAKCYEFFVFLWHSTVFAKNSLPVRPCRLQGLIGICLLHELWCVTGGLSRRHRDRESRAN